MERKKKAQGKEPEIKQGKELPAEFAEAKKPRVIATPGEVVATGDWLPGEGTQREGNEIIATRFGLLEKADKLVRVIPLSGAYIPRRGNIVIGQVIDVTWNGWIVDIIAPYSAFLPVTECYGRVDKRELTDYYTFRDMIVTKIKAVKSRGIDLTMKEAGLKKLEGGLIVHVNPTRVPRVIGRAGSMVNTIKSGTDCNIIVGQNGIIWIRGKSVDDELLAKEAIELVARKSFVEGLTEKIKAFLLEQKEKRAKGAK